MSESEPSTPSTPAAKAKATRVSGDSRYPKYDLDSCIVMADKIKNGGGNDCTVEQLGGLLGYTNTSGGGFATRVANAKMFGLIETVGGRYRITQRAETILYPATPEEGRRARAEAFLSVPLYSRIYEMHKGQRLPEALGLQNLLHRSFQIPAGEAVATAQKVMLDSADQAGFFTATKGQRTNLIMPIGGAGPAPKPPEEERTENRNLGGGGGFSGGSGGGGPRIHPALAGLLTLIPSEPGPWSGRTAFDEAWKSAMEVLYPKPTQDGGG
jgi:hypothetical protein